MIAWTLKVVSVVAVAAPLGFGGYPAPVAVAARVLFYVASVVLLFTALAALVQRAQPRAD